jgi:Mrp family chromosome partitioning ATPase
MNPLVYPQQPHTTPPDDATGVSEGAGNITPSSEAPGGDVSSPVAQRVGLSLKAQAARSMMQHTPEQAALPIHVEPVATQPETIQMSLLEQQAKGISETILFHYQEQKEENGARKPRGLRLTQSSRRQGQGHTSGTPRVIGVTSAVAGEGKTTVALHVALALARNSYKNICLVDLGLGKEVLCGRLGIPAPAYGGVDVLEWDGESDPEFLPLPLLRSDDERNLYLLPAGRQPVRAERTAHSPRVGDLINIAKAWTDIVVVDLPNINSGNILPMREYLDGIVVVVRAGVTPKDVVNAALDRVGRERILGVVLNGQESPLPGWLGTKFGGMGA